MRRLWVWIIEERNHQLLPFRKKKPKKNPKKTPKNTVVTDVTAIENRTGVSISLGAEIVERSGSCASIIRDVCHFSSIMTIV
jgi:hypothetical protein